MIAYKYSSKTFEYLGIVEYEGKELPPYTTDIEPPEVESYQVQVFNTEDEEWTIEADYRRKQDIHGFLNGGKPYYNPSKYWWSAKYYMVDIGDIPEGMTFDKMDKPDVVVNCANLMNERTRGKEYLDSTDKNWIELQAYQNGYRKYLTEEEVAEMEAIEVERDRVATSINSNKSTIASLKEQIKETYGEEALEHILD